MTELAAPSPPKCGSDALRLTYFVPSSAKSIRAGYPPFLVRPASRRAPPDRLRIRRGEDDGPLQPLPHAGFRGGVDQGATAQEERRPCISHVPLLAVLHNGFRC
jgi:hypothetical protein